MTVPSDRNSAMKEMKKKQVQRPRTKNTENARYEKHSNPCGCGTLDTVKKGMIKNIKKVSEKAIMTEIQKICKLESAQILRRCSVYK